MSDMQTQKGYEIGMVGLGVMGRNLVRNIADHEFSVAVYDKDPTKVQALRKESAQRNIRGTASLPEFIALLRQPRAVMMLVPAGAPVDSVIKDLSPHLDKGDLIIDAGKGELNGYLEWFRWLISMPIAALGCRPISSRPNATISERTPMSGTMLKARFTRNRENSQSHEND